jgi:endonuclease/exonuclease/phosphatase family metal-dependent hydrolase
VRRPAPEVLATVVLVLVLAGAGSGIALIATRTPDQPTARLPGAAPSSSAPATPGAGPVEPSPAPTGRRPRPRPPGAPQPSVTASACPALTEEVPLRVVSLNVHSGYGPGGFDVAGIARYLELWEVDVALLQEVDRFRAHSRFVDMPGVLARETGMEVAYGVNVRQGPRGQYGVATLSRFPITLERNTLLPNGPGLQQRGVLRTDLDVGGATVSVFNTHLEHRSKPMRLRQVAATRDLLAQTPHPAVLGGDLNSAPGSPMMALARSFARDAWTAAGSGPGATVPAGNPRVRIDYVMYTPPLRATRAEVMSSVISDHRAVLARLVLTVAGDEVCVPELDGAVGETGPGRGRAGRGG